MRVEVLIAVTMKIIFFSDVSRYTLIDVYQCSGETYCLHLQGKRELFYPEDGTSMFL
jgi:hypothetical protein